ncbi:MAG: methyltransferase domain-containing protein [Nanoarchaeota archaeon]
MKPIKKVLIDEKGNRHFWSQGDLQTDLGILKEEDIKNSSGKIKSHLKKDFIIFDANFIDKLEKLKRGPAIITKKDIGYIIASTGLHRNSKVLDAGTGSGFLTLFLSRITLNIVTYEKNPEFLDIAKKNFKDLGIEIEIKQKDIYQGIDEKNLDLIVLDLPEPWEVLDHAKKSLRNGQFLVCYLPTISQVIKLVEKSKDKFLLEEVAELLKREWHIEGLKVRPKSQMIAHTAFLVFLRNF